MFPRNYIAGLLLSSRILIAEVPAIMPAICAVSGRSSRLGRHAQNGAKKRDAAANAGYWHSRYPPPDILPIIYDFRETFTAREGEGGGQRGVSICRRQCQGQSGILRDGGKYQISINVSIKIKSMNSPAFASFHSTQEHLIRQHKYRGALET